MVDRCRLRMSNSTEPASTSNFPAINLGKCKLDTRRGRSFARRFRSMSGLRRQPAARPSWLPQACPLRSCKADGMCSIQVVLGKGGSSPRQVQNALSTSSRISRKADVARKSVAAAHQQREVHKADLGATMWKVPLALLKLVYSSSDDLLAKLLNGCL